MTGVGSGVDFGVVVLAPVVDFLAPVTFVFGVDFVVVVVVEFVVVVVFFVAAFFFGCFFLRCFLGFDLVVSVVVVLLVDDEVVGGLCV